MIGRPTMILKLLGLVALTTLTMGCVRGCTSSRPPIHIVPNMDWQPKYETQEASDFFYDGAAMRQPVPGTVARGQLWEDLAQRTGKDAAGVYLASSPMPQTEQLLARGAERYDIFCRPCHDKQGTGKGIMYEHGGVPTPSFHEERFLVMPDGEVFKTITEGTGLMKGYGYPIPPADRWAIIAHVRRLQQQRQAIEMASAGR